MSCEVVAVGSELLLGQIADTNSSWIGQALAAVGINSHYQVKVGDNLDRMVEVIDLALSRSDAVITTGGLGPTQDDVTREAIARVLGVELETDEDLVEKIEAMWGLRGREMPANNRLQARIPAGAAAIPVQPGTAPGLIAEVERDGSTKVIYAVPGVPWEMQTMMNEFILDDLIRRSGRSLVFRSRVLRTWGQSESGLAEDLADEIDRLDKGSDVTLAFLASGIEGLKVRITASGADEASVLAKLDDEEQRVREIIGPIVFGLDDENMEAVVLRLCREQGLTLGTAESLTGGLIAQRLTEIPGASTVFRGSIVSYANDLKGTLLNAPDGPSVSEETAEAMAIGACDVLDVDCSVATTGVAGPDPWEGIPPGTIWIATCVDGVAESHLLRYKTDRDRARNYTTITALNELRKRLEARLLLDVDHGVADG